MEKKDFKVNSINDFISLIRNWYSTDYCNFRTKYLKAVETVNPFPQDTDPSVEYEWNKPEDEALDNLCDFFQEWYQWNPDLETGLQYIQKFSWLYYENQNGLNFVTGGIGYLMTAIYVDLNGQKMDSSESKTLVKHWMTEIGKEEMSKYIIPEGGYQNFNQFFSRELVTPRPVSSPNDDSVVVSPADAIVNMIDDNLTVNKPLSIKTQELSVYQLLNGSEYTIYFEGGTAVSNILMPTVYHRYHSPVSGKVIESNEDVAGIYFGIKDFPELIHNGDVGYGYDYSIFEHFRRGYLIIETKEYGKVAMIPVGLNTISSVIFDSKFKKITSGDTPQPIVKGEEVGYFQYGGSLNILLFEKGVFPAVRIPQGQEIGTMNKKTATKVQFNF